MATVEHGELQVVVPVGFLLTEAQEVTVSVDRPGRRTSLRVRLRLIPARPVEAAGIATLVAADDPVSVSTPTPLRMSWPKRVHPEDDGYGEPEYGGGRLISHFNSSPYLMFSARPRRGRC